MTARIGIVTISDRASQGVYEDRGGPAIRECLTEILSSPWEPVPRLIPDERPAIEATLKELADREGCCLIVTTGGTGPARRDVTPEATEAVEDGPEFADGVPAEDEVAGGAEGEGGPHQEPGVRSQGSGVRIDGPWLHYADACFLTPDP